MAWLEAVHHVRWPSKLAHAVDYLVDLKISEAPPSVPQAFGATLAFFEKVGGIPNEAMFSSDPAYRMALNQCIKEKESGRKDRRPAPLLALAVLISLEFRAMDFEEKAFVRFMAWVKLLKIWTASRTDDLMGLKMDSIKMGKPGLMEDEGFGSRQEEQVPSIHSEPQCNFCKH